ncbi:LRR receptor-like serine/threonine-protein kinase RKF3 [Pyrus ussuriensis x Pyrus communis]|uniref:LRR receptor-like serine/threonine-protein kinase RKF3 n=1 Tax=Pyrus ussuriensis x Pyrus communis TaxID=2448454 RepID=A0A5N5FLU9_9ROSA|nr:LRR receptor-like serine/threonine-protein kinase RKF3 [Pyrus ussuriensis x Pyrus communis]
MSSLCEDLASSALHPLSNEITAPHQDGYAVQVETSPTDSSVKSDLCKVILVVQRAQGDPFLTKLVAGGGAQQDSEALGGGWKLPVRRRY